MLLIALAVTFPPCCPQLWHDPDDVHHHGSALAGWVSTCPTSLVGQRKKSRGESIFLGLPDALDLMVVCVEAGLGLDAAMRRVTSELAQSCPVLCEEFAIANFQLQMGRPRQGRAPRPGHPHRRRRRACAGRRDHPGREVRLEHRVGLARSIRRHAPERRQLAEERAAKTSVKIMIPLIFFIFPGVFVVLVGPAVLRIAVAHVA